MKWVYLLLGGMTGTTMRYAVSGAARKLFGETFPIGTLIVNVFGCFLAGFFISAWQGKIYSDLNLRLFLLVGFCGAFTTFSAFMLETSHLIKSGQSLQAFMNVSVSLLAGFAIFRMGVLTGEGI